MTFELNGWPTQWQCNLRIPLLLLLIGRLGAFGGRTHESKPAPLGRAVFFLVGSLGIGLRDAAAVAGLLLQGLLLLAKRRLLAGQPRTFQRQVELDLPELGLPLRFEIGNALLEWLGDFGDGLKTSGQLPGCFPQQERLSQLPDNHIALADCRLSVCG